jgi:hypothetical protein
MKPVQCSNAGGLCAALFARYLFDLDHWHIKQPPENLASIDPAGAYIAQQAAAILQEEDEQSSADDDGSKGTLYNSFFTGTRSCSRTDERL